MVVVVLVVLEVVVEVPAKRFCQIGVAIAMAASSVVCLLHQSWTT